MTPLSEIPSREARELAQLLTDTFGSDEIQYATFERSGDNWLLRRFTRIPPNPAGPFALTRPSEPSDGLVERTRQHVVPWHDGSKFKADILTLCDLAVSKATAIQSLQERVRVLEAGFRLSDKLTCAAIREGFYVGEGLLDQLEQTRRALHPLEQPGCGDA